MIGLEPRKAEILRRRFGLDGGLEETLDEIAVHFGVSKERIRQIERDAKRSVAYRLKASGVKISDEAMEKLMLPGQACRRA